MTSYTATPSMKKGKFGLLPDGTLGYPKPLEFPIPAAGYDNLPPVREFSIRPSAYDITYTGNDVSHVDWFRATATGSDILFTLNELAELLTLNADGDVDTDFYFTHSDKGLLGYPKSIRVSVLTDGGLQLVGSFCYQDDPLSSNCGVMIDLSGQFFTYITTHAPDKITLLYQYLSGYGFRVSRIDIALDLVGDYCRANALTVPVFQNLGKHRGLFNSEHSHNGQALTLSTAGDWSLFAFGSDSFISIADYDPALHAPKGLTVNFGSRKNPNFFRVYEKSKQLIALADLGDDHDLDKWAVRIEHEIKRDKDGAPIPLEILLSPDAFFGLGRPELRSLFDAYCRYLIVPAAAVVHRNRFKKMAVVSLKAKMFWGRRSYGRLIRTLKNTGMSDQDIFDQLGRDSALKDFVYDLVNDLDLFDEDGFCSV